MSSLLSENIEKGLDDTKWLWTCGDIPKRMQYTSSIPNTDSLANKYNRSITGEAPGSWSNCSSNADTLKTRCGFLRLSPLTTCVRGSVFRVRSDSSTPDRPSLRKTDTWTQHEEDYKHMWLTRVLTFSLQHWTRLGSALILEVQLTRHQQRRFGLWNTHGRVIKNRDFLLSIFW